MNYLIGIGLIAIGVFSLYKVYTKKAKQSDRLVFKHQIFIFEKLFGKENAYNSLVIFTSIIEIVFGLAFVFGALTI